MTKRRRAELTFKENLKHGRHGWLRLTPAYSVKLVAQVLAEHPDARQVLDPFSGTGTTGLVCAERGIECELLEINPFLVWFARAKVAPYSEDDQQAARRALTNALRHTISAPATWEPPISNIERWWPERRRALLSRILNGIREATGGEGRAADLLLIAFCRCVIEWSNAAFNHQSMSFKEADEATLSSADEEASLLAEFQHRAEHVIRSSASPIRAAVNVVEADSRSVPPPPRPYDTVVTSPPYPNRMSYIRELRPYMYWLGYLTEAREAGELDWQAIGGTWGIATSRVGEWSPNGSSVPYAEFDGIVGSIADSSPLLANYVHKYFADIVEHVSSLARRMAPGGQVYYIVGNSKFYKTLVPVERIYASIFEAHGFRDAAVEIVRKRNSKKELYEYVVSATRC